MDGRSFIFLDCIYSKSSGGGPGWGKIILKKTKSSVNYATVIQTTLQFEKFHHYKYYFLSLFSIYTVHLLEKLMT